MTTPATNVIYHENVFFTGHVQGVGFRYSTMQVAKEYEVAGYVTNLFDGRVQIEVEGREKEVKDFMTAVENRLHGYIRKIDRTHTRRAPQFSGFMIK